MPTFRRTAWVMASLFLVPTFVLAQSLGDVAAKEKEKKKSQKPAKVYTEDDLKRAGNGDGSNFTVDAPASGDAAQKGDAPKTDAKKPEKSDDDIKAEKQTAWHKDLDKAQAQIATDQKLVDTIQAALSASTSYYDPSRAQAMNDLETAKTKLAADQQALADLQEQGRRRGYR